VRRHDGGDAAVLRGGLLHALRARAAQRLRDRGPHGRPAHEGAAGAHPKIQAAVRGLQPGLHLPPRQRWHDALLDRLVEAVDDPRHSQADRHPPEGDGAHGRGLHGRGACDARGLAALHERGLHGGNDRRRARALRPRARGLRAGGGLRWNTNRSADGWRLRAGGCWRPDLSRGHGAISAFAYRRHSFSSRRAAWTTSGCGRRTWCWFI